MLSSISQCPLLLHAIVDGYQPETQLLLREIREHSDNEMEPYNQPQMHYSRPMLANSHRLLAGQYQTTGQPRSGHYSPPPLFEAQVSRRLDCHAYNKQDQSLNTHSMLLITVQGLDYSWTIDRELLAEPQGYAEDGTNRLLQPQGSQYFPNRGSYGSRSTVQQREPPLYIRGK